jgi:hypothetical protein
MPRLRPERFVVLLVALLLLSTWGAFAAFNVTGHAGWKSAAGWLLLAVLVVASTPLIGFLLLRLRERLGRRP